MEITNNSVQTVAANQNVLFTDTPIKGNNSIIHREGSGLVILRGCGSQYRARYRIAFNGNIAIPSGGTIEAISLAIALNGEAVGPANMIFTPAAVSEYGNVSSSVYVEVPKCCCYSISVQNTSTESILVQNANLIVERVA